MKKIIIILIIAFLAPAAQSQQQDSVRLQQNRHELSAGAGISISTILNTISAGSKQSRTGYSAGIGYTYYFSYNWGLSSGLEFSHTPTAVTVGLITDQSLVWNRWFDYYHTESRYTKEEHRFYHINIPLMARYQFYLPSKHTLKPYLAAGPAFGIPVGNSYHTQRTITSSGVNFPDQTGYTKDPFENMPHHGFHNSLQIDYRDKFKKKLYITAVIEAGIKYELNSRTGIYAGIFAGIGLNDIVNRPGRDLLNNPIYPGFAEYNHRNPSDPVVNSILTSAYGYVTPENGGLRHETPFLKHVNTLSAGLKLGITFGAKPFDRKIKPVEPAPYEDPWDKPVTGNQMQKLLDKQTADLTDAQRRALDSLRNFLQDEQAEPDLSAPIYCFDFDRHNIPHDMKAVLDHKAELMKKYPMLNITIEGHTDSAGSDRYNYNLGMRRADAAKHYLVSKGVAGSRMNITSKGRSEPIVRNIEGDKVANCPNRRVEFIIRK